MSKPIMATIIPRKGCRSQQVTNPISADVTAALLLVDGRNGTRRTHETRSWAASMARRQQMLAS
ncbi:MAG TPA: hypothetical protein VGT79_03755, partial [Xanthomonadaceae bacterium]|nr:hypothetical protein [Xanthomonadaceae bacterium]